MAVQGIFCVGIITQVHYSFGAISVHVLPASAVAS